MDPDQFKWLLAALGLGLSGIAAAIKWVGGRITSSIDRNSDAMIENTASNAVLSTKIDGIAKFVQLREESSSQTPPRGVPVTTPGYARPSTKGGGS